MIDLNRSTIKLNFKPNSSRNPHSSFCQKASAIALWISVANCVPIRLLAPVFPRLKIKRSRSHNQQMPAPAAAVQDLHPGLEYAIGFGRGFISSKMRGRNKERSWEILERYQRSLENLMDWLRSDEL